MNTHYFYAASIVFGGNMNASIHPFLTVHKHNKQGTEIRSNHISALGRNKLSEPGQTSTPLAPKISPAKSWRHLSTFLLQPAVRKKLFSFPHPIRVWILMATSRV